ncbi:hypothetical protein NDU88_004584 [Pleurodeles waltl]|uniref:Uncharacterized protein n=1 Tax=Pleurodeles waltl TaxID=8319 RepID=A0AAV7PFM8_PLEWA|nr:hypothetical protein NDU88_004584 [Pleurodeles waltl]
MRRAGLSMQSLPSWSEQLLQGFVQMATNQHSGARVVKLHLKHSRRLADQEEKVPFLVHYGRASKLSFYGCTCFTNRKSDIYVRVEKMGDR